MFFVRFLIEVAQDLKTMMENLASVGVDDVEDLAARCLHREMLKNWSHGGREMTRKKRAPRGTVAENELRGRGAVAVLSVRTFSPGWPGQPGLKVPALVSNDL